MPVEGGEARKVTNSETAVSSFQWSPDGKSIFYVANLAPDAEGAKRLRDGYDEIVVGRNPRFAQLWRASLDAKPTDKPEEVIKGNTQVVDFDIAPDGKRIAFTARPTPS